MGLRDFLTTPVSALFRRSVAVDEMGRDLTPTSKPPSAAMFLPRVRDRYTSSFQQQWTPDRIAWALQQAEIGDFSQQAELCEYMEDRDGILGGFMQTRRLAPAGLRWHADPRPNTDDPDLAMEIAAFTEGELRSIETFDHTRRDMFDAIGKGISALRVNWQEGGRTKQSRFRIDSIDWINAKRYRFHWAKEQFLILPDDWSSGDMPTSPFDHVNANYLAVGVAPPPWKVLLHRSRVFTTHPGRAGLLRRISFPFAARNLALKDFMVYCEIFGMPLRLGKYTEASSDEDRAALASALVDLGSDSAAIVSDETMIEFPTARQAGPVPYRLLREDCSKEYEILVLGQEHTNTSNKHGNRANTESGGAKVKQDLLEADALDGIVSLSRDIAYPIVGFSKYGWLAASKYSPIIKLEYEPEQDYEKMIATDVPLHVSLGLPATNGQLARRYNRELPEGVDPKALIAPTPGPTVGLPFADVQLSGAEGGAPDKQKSSFARELTRELVSEALRKHYERGAATHSQGAVDDFADRAVDAAAEALGSLTDPLRALVMSAESLADLERRIRSAYSDVDASTLERYVRRSVYVANLYGRSSVRKAAETKGTQS